MKKIIPVSYSTDDRGLNRYRLDYTGNGKWAIRWADQCLTKKENWIYEPLPSARTESFFKKTRFSFKKGMDMFKKLLKQI